MRCHLFVCVLSALPATKIAHSVILTAPIVLYMPLVAAAHPITHSMICLRHGDGAHAVASCARESLNCLTFENSEGHESTPPLPSYILTPAQNPNAPPLSKPDLLVITDISPADLATADKAT